MKKGDLKKQSQFIIVQRSECCGLRVDSRLRGNDKQQISAFIWVNLRLMNLKKQSQFQNRQNGVKSILTMVYGDFDGPGQRKNKANQSQKPAFGRKSEARNTKSDNSGGVAGCLLHRVGREMS